ncbi:MAG TPA: MotA/TolQ/ExbB proton channel family protein [Gammaproteobacteria bacterium]|nr:MotA/TolQ/ExbB proton channel family protein [Gammaproteobacteria bacterium]
MFSHIPLLDSIAYLAGQGGTLVLWIFATGVLLWTLTAERTWYFWRVLPKEKAAVRAEWDAREDHTSWCARQIREGLISRLNVSMTKGHPVLSVLVAMAPLIGLVGTVTGMLQVFSSMSILGTADARAMAAGVSAAMINTMTGLAVAVSGLYPVYYFRSRATRETEQLADELSV